MEAEPGLSPRPSSGFRERRAVSKNRCPPGRARAMVTEGVSFLHAPRHHSDGCIQA